MKLLVFAVTALAIGCAVEPPTPPTTPLKLPDPGPYKICHIEKGPHGLSIKDPVVIRPLGAVTIVTLGRREIRMFFGTQGLLGDAEFEQDGKLRLHYIGITKTLDPHVDCKRPTAKIQIEFASYDEYGNPVPSADPDGGHVHAEQ